METKSPKIEIKKIFTKVLCEDILKIYPGIKLNQRLNIVQYATILQHFENKYSKNMIYTRRNCVWNSKLSRLILFLKEVLIQYHPNED